MNKQKSIALMISLYLHLLIIYLPIDNHYKENFEKENIHYISFVETNSLQRKNKKVNTNKLKPIQSNQDYKSFDKVVDSSKVISNREENTNIVKDSISFDEVVKKPTYVDTKQTDVNEHSSIIKNYTKDGEGELSNSSYDGKEKTSLPDNNFDDVIVNAEFGKDNGPSFKSRVLPEYPALAKKLGKSGEIVLLLLIDEKGILKNIEVLKSDDFGFTESAINAIKRSTFIPANINGKPVSSKARLTIKFILK